AYPSFKIPMYRLFSTLLLFTFIFGCTPSEESKTARFSFPPEWEPHQAVWMSINNVWGDEQEAAGQISARLKVTQALSKYVPVKVLTNADSMAVLLTDSLLHYQVDTSQVKIIVHPLPHYFMRDTGPIFISNGEQLRMANWNWKCLNKWCDEVNNLRGTIDDSLAIRFGYEVQDSPINYEGGAIVVNSHSALSIQDYVLEQNEGNIPLAEIEKEILNLYGKEQMIWLEGIPLLERNGFKTEKYFGQGADGHVDALVRFANDSTLLVTTISEEDKDKSPIQQHDYEIYQGYLKQLKTKKRQNGQPFTIVEIPSPDISLHEYKLPAASFWDVIEQYEITDKFTKEDTVKMIPTMGYANYLVSNGVVLVAQYWEEGLPLSEKQKDEKMVELLSQYFPNREIVGIPAKTINWYGGGIHCATQQEPQVAKR
ncbi:MAG: agmatine deiminase family protein, partial [Bacteroidota bacterium]